MKKQKLERGQYGYLKEKKQKSLFGTLLMVVIGIAIFVIGLLLNKMEATNVFTVIAICMVMPAAKYFVSYVILFPYKPMDLETKKRLDSYAKEEDTLLYDVVFTSSEKVMHLDCIYVTGHQVIGYTSRAKDKVQIMQDYLKKELKLRGISYAVFIATEEKQIKDRMKLRGEEAAEATLAAKEEVLSMLRTFTV
ncbi:MAG: hypothetical protein J6K15_06940 [Lachnospiraceae bacterium]|nr:hypothetical protein [Lachnospiraceae bacterium]